MVWKLHYDYRIDDPYALSDYLLGEEVCCIEVAKKAPFIIMEAYTSTPFVFSEIQEERNYRLDLESFGELVQRIKSSVKTSIEQVPDSDAIKRIARYLGKENVSRVRYTQEKKTGVNKPYDFEAIASYALKRFPCIAAELRLHPLKVSLDFPAGFLEDKYITDTLLFDETLNTEYLEENVCSQFYRYYCKAVNNIEDLPEVEIADLVKLVEAFNGD